MVQELSDFGLHYAVREDLTSGSPFNFRMARNQSAAR